MKITDTGVLKDDFCDYSYKHEEKVSRSMTLQT